MKIRYIVILILLFILVGCNNKLNKEVTLTGEIITREIMIDREKQKISILSLDSPLVINGTSVNSVKLNNNEEIEDNTRITVKGILEENEDTSLDILYEVDVKSVAI